jgi:hypothetical protein
MFGALLIFHVSEVVRVVRGLVDVDSLGDEALHDLGLLRQPRDTVTDDVRVHAVLAAVLLSVSTQLHRAVRVPVLAPVKGAAVGGVNTNLVDVRSHNLFLSSLVSAPC